MGETKKGRASKSESTEGGGSLGGGAAPPSPADDTAVADEPTCPICLDTAGRTRASALLNVGCACRGAAGRAHLRCLVEYAKPEITVSDSWRWRGCPTCKQPYTGPVQLGLARTQWALTRHLPGYDDIRVAAAENLAIALMECADCVRGEEDPGNRPGARPLLLVVPRLLMSDVSSPPIPPSRASPRPFRGEPGDAADDRRRRVSGDPLRARADHLCRARVPCPPPVLTRRRSTSGRRCSI